MVPGCGGGAEREKMGEALGLRRFSGTVKQEVQLHNQRLLSCLIRTCQPLDQHLSATLSAENAIGRGLGPRDALKKDSRPLLPS